MTTASVQTTKLEDLLEWDENPLFVATRTCIIFLQELFTAAPKGSFHWNIDPEVTDIVITDEVPLHSEVVEKRPAIVTVRSAVAFAGIGLDQLEDLDIRTGAEAHTDLISGNLTFNCMSRIKVEAEYLGWQVARHIWLFRHYLMKSGFHKIGEQTQMMSPSPPQALISGDTEAEIVNVAVVVPFYFQWRDVIMERDLPKLKSIQTRLEFLMTDVIKPDTTTRLPLRGTAPYAEREVLKSGKIRPPSMRGRRLTPVVYPGSQPSDPPITVTVKTGKVGE